MLFRKTGSLAVVRLHPGEEVVEGISAALRKARWKSAVILGGIGLVDNAKLAFLKNGKYIATEFNRAAELVSLQGSACFDERGQVVVHAHASLAQAKPGRMAATGGHMVSASVNVTAEIFLLNSTPLRFFRRVEKSSLKGIALQ